MWLRRSDSTFQRLLVIACCAVWMRGLCDSWQNSQIPLPESVHVMHFYWMSFPAAARKQFHPSRSQRGTESGDTMENCTVTFYAGDTTIYRYSIVIYIYNHKKHFIQSQYIQYIRCIPTPELVTIFVLNDGKGPAMTTSFSSRAALSQSLFMIRIEIESAALSRFFMFPDDIWYRS